MMGIYLTPVTTTCSGFAMEDIRRSAGAGGADAAGSSGSRAAEMLPHQAEVSLEHLEDYPDEFTFRFHRRKPRSRGKLFYQLLDRL